MNGSINRRFAFKRLNRYVEHTLSMLQHLEEYSEYISSFRPTNVRFHLTEIRDPSYIPAHLQTAMEP